MLDIQGFLTSTAFVEQIASMIAALLSILVGDFIARLFGGSA